MMKFAQTIRANAIFVDAAICLAAFAALVLSTPCGSYELKCAIGVVLLVALIGPPLAIITGLWYTPSFPKGDGPDD